MFLSQRVPFNVTFHRYFAVRFKKTSNVNETKSQKESDQAQTNYERYSTWRNDHLQ